MALKGAMVPIAQSYCVFRQMSQNSECFYLGYQRPLVRFCLVEPTALHVKFWPTNELADSDDFEKKRS